MLEHAFHAGRPFSDWFWFAIHFEISIADGVMVTLNKLKGFIFVLGYNVDAARASRILIACPR